MKYRCPKCGEEYNRLNSEVEDAYCSCCGKWLFVNERLERYLSDCWTKAVRLEQSFAEFAASEGCREPETAGVFLQRKAVSSDEQVVARFNELVKEGKIEYCPGTSEWDIVRFSQYRLRPTPQYRPFTAVEAVAHLSCRVKSKKHGYETFFSGFGVDYHESKKINLHFGDPHKGVSVRTPQEALEEYEFLTGEPFGVKED